MKRKYYCTNPVYDFKHLYNVICNSDGFGTRNLNFWVLVTRIGSKMGFIKGKLNMDSLYFIYFWHTYLWIFQCFGPPSESTTI